jgi:hypothetical protein
VLPRVLEVGHGSHLVDRSRWSGAKFGAAVFSTQVGLPCADSEGCERRTGRGYLMEGAEKQERTLDPGRLATRQCCCVSVRRQAGVVD